MWNRIYMVCGNRVNMVHGNRVMRLGPVYYRATKIYQTYSINFIQIYCLYFTYSFNQFLLML